MHRRIAGATIGAGVALMLAAPAAGAATRTVEAGPFGAAPAKFEAVAGDANMYFRRVVKVHKGDKVTWNINGFHSVTFQPEGDPAPGLVAPDPVHPVSGINDADGKPFWFNGQPTLAVNPLAAFPQGHKRFNPGELTSSGLPLAPGKPAPYTLRFRFKGTFRYLCVLHPGMNGEVRVVGRNKKIPSKAKNRRVAKREQRAALARVRALSGGDGLGALADTIQAGNDTADGATVFKFFPAAPTFHVGDKVTLQMSPASSEVHTFTFGPTDANLALAEALLGVAIDPRGGYPSDEPPGVVSYNGRNHGNGFFNSGFLDSDGGTPLPTSTSIRFTSAGTYSLICLIHPFMRSTVTVGN